MPYSDMPLPPGALLGADACADLLGMTGCEQDLSGNSIAILERLTTSQHYSERTDEEACEGMTPIDVDGPPQGDCDSIDRTGNLHDGLGARTANVDSVCGRDGLEPHF